MYKSAIEKKWEDIDLNYEGENKFASFFSNDGNIHSYPAKAVPEMVNSLLIKLKAEYDIKTVMDPFVGSGTIALETKYLGLDFYGSDLNPLAVLLSRTKVLTIKNTPYIKKRLQEFTGDLINNYKKTQIIVLENFKNIGYWFKEENIRELSYIKSNIDNFLNHSKGFREIYALILLTAFSSTIRRSSLTRSGEFKLYRMSTNDIEKFNVDSTLIFREKVDNLLNMLVFANNSYKEDTISKICMHNAKNLSYMPDAKVDLIITSPPYGDSKSTVAYGQFSRLSLQWMKELLRRHLNIDYDIDNCDEYLLGGAKSKPKYEGIECFSRSKILSKLISEIDNIIEHDMEEKRLAKDKLLEVIGSYKEKKYDRIKNLITENDILFRLISERIRLDIYRKINNKKSNLKNKKIKELAKAQRDCFIKDILSDKKKISFKRLAQLEDKLPYVLETIERKFQALPSRKEEVIHFFKDLFEVVLESDRVLRNGGIQTWIVGHRTVFEKITVNMEGILKEWFESLGYTTVTSLQRKYSFKRMPHHINSTMLRNEKVQTMMHEYILIVKKH